MADPYVINPPANVGACSATWYVGPETWQEGSTGSDPTFGNGFYVSGNPNRFTGAWDYLVPGPLKDVLTAEVPVGPDSFTIIMQRWAAAGGQINIIGLDSDGNSMLGAMAKPWITVGGGVITPPQMGWVIDSSTYVTDSNPPALYTDPIRWVIRFSVPHSIVR